MMPPFTQLLAVIVTVLAACPVVSKAGRLWYDWTHYTAIRKNAGRWESDGNHRA